MRIGQTVEFKAGGNYLSIFPGCGLKPGDKGKIIDIEFFKDENTKPVYKIYLDVLQTQEEYAEPSFIFQDELIFLEDQLEFEF